MADESGRSPRELLRAFGPEWTLAIGIFLMLLAYVPALSAPFVFDDHNDLLTHDALHRLWPPEWFWSSRRPFVVFTFALNWALTPGEPLLFRAVNLAIHGASGLFAYVLAREVLASLPNSRDRERTRWIAAAAAALWLVHPLHTSAVTYIVHRYESLTGLLSLTTLTFFLRARRKNDRSSLALASGSALLASLSKETAVTLLPLALALDVATRASGEGRLPGTILATLRDRSGHYAALALAFVPLALLLWLIPSGATQKFDTADFGPLDYLLSEPRALALYARLLVWPWPLSIDYYDFPVARSLAEIPVVGWCAIGTVVVVVAGAFRGKLAAFAPFLALVCLAPTSTFVPLRYELVAERRLYLASLPLVIAGVALASRLADTPSRRRLLTTLLGGLLLAATGTTLARNSDYLDRLGLYAREVRHRPNNARARAWFAQYLADAGEFDAARAELIHAERLDPNVPFLERQRARVAALLGRHEEAARYAEETLRRHPDDEASLVVVSMFYPPAGRGQELVDLLLARGASSPLPELAWLELARGLATVPTRRDGQRALGIVDGVFGSAESPELVETRIFALAALGRFDEAERLWRGLVPLRGEPVRRRIAIKLSRRQPIDASDLVEESPRALGEDAEKSP